jgi:hypothetical protein
MPASPYPSSRRELAGNLLSAVVLCLASLASGGLGALLTIRLLYPHGPSLWRLVRMLVSNAVSLLSALLPAGVLL